MRIEWVGGGGGGIGGGGIGGAGSGPGGLLPRRDCPRKAVENHRDQFVELGAKRSALPTTSVVCHVEAPEVNGVAT
jgi:hypothetical protein